MADDSATAAATGATRLVSLIGSIVGAYMAYGYTNSMGLSLGERLLAIGVGAAGGGTIVAYLLVVAITVIGLIVLVLWTVAGMLSKDV